MAPFRERTSSTSKTRPKKQRNVEKSPNALPGIQKIKAALRQTRRLLAKDKLAADLRVETERRLKALEADLQSAEVKKKERTLATRYHKVKFFERQKVTRKIKQVQNRLSLEQNKSEKKTLTSELQELRIDLNYVFHYPKLKKYISLFPPDVEKGDSISQSQAQKANAEREEIRSWIRDCMERGELPTEPELTLGSHRENERMRPGSWSKDDLALEAKSLSWKGPVAKVEEDDFFVDDSDEDDGHD